jgi:hypothetical protein
MPATTLQQVAKPAWVSNRAANAGDALPRTDRRAAHQERIRLRNAQIQRLNGVWFQVIDVATGQALPGGPHPYDFAKYVRDARDLFNAGAFLVKRIAPGKTVTLALARHVVESTL